MVIFEILREGDMRIPSTMSASMSIVGALVLGQASVDAGIVSPISVIVVAITSICGLIFSDIDFTSGIRSWRFLFIIGSTMLGFIGILAVTIILIVKLVSLENLGTSYLSPFTPLNIKAQKDAVIKMSSTNIFDRPSYISKKNITKQKRKDD